MDGGRQWRLADECWARPSPFSDSGAEEDVKSEEVLGRKHRDAGRGQNPYAPEILVQRFAGRGNHTGRGETLWQNTFGTQFALNGLVSLFFLENFFWTASEALKESLCVSHYFVIVPITLPGKVAIRILSSDLWENQWIERGRRRESLPNERKTLPWDFVSVRRPGYASKSSIPRSNCFASAALRTHGSMTSYKFSRLASPRSSGTFLARMRFCGKSENADLPA